MPLYITSHFIFPVFLKGCGSFLSKGFSASVEMIICFQLKVCLHTYYTYQTLYVEPNLYLEMKPTRWCLVCKNFVKNFCFNIPQGLVSGCLCCCCVLTLLCCQSNARLKCVWRCPFPLYAMKQHEQWFEALENLVEFVGASASPWAFLLGNWQLPYCSLLCGST